MELATSRWPTTAKQSTPTRSTSRAPIATGSRRSQITGGIRADVPGPAGKVLRPSSSSKAPCTEGDIAASPARARPSSLRAPTKAANARPVTSSSRHAMSSRLSRASGSVAMVISHAQSDGIFVATLAAATSSVQVLVSHAEIWTRSCAPRLSGASGMGRALSPAGSGATGATLPIACSVSISSPRFLSSFSTSNTRAI